MEEEKLKKAIDLLKSEISVYDTYYCLATSQALKTVLNELERLQKENESLVKQYEWQGAILVNEYMPLKDIKQLFIPKQVVRNKIEEVNKEYKKYTEKWEKSGMNKEHPFYRYIVRLEAQIDILEELLNEVN